MKRYTIFVRSSVKTWNKEYNTIRIARREAKTYIKKMLPEKEYIHDNFSYISENFYAIIKEHDSMIYVFTINENGKIVESKIDEWT